MNEKIYSNKLVESFQNHFDKESFKYITYPKFIFLCGRGFESAKQYKNTNRGIIEQFIKKNYSDAFIVLSEKLWEESFCDNIDLLTFEEFLAEVSDAIILFVESPGTFCELGAFAYADVLFSDKLIIVMDEKYQNDKSFLSEGPVSKAQKDKSKVIYAQLNEGALLSSNDLRQVILELINKFSNKSSTINKRLLNSDANKIQINSFIIEILELIRITQPIRFDSLLVLYKKVKKFSSFSFIKRDMNPFHSEIKPGYIRKLLENVGLIKNEGDYLSLSNHEKTQNLMFRYQGQAEQSERNRILCRKYKWGDNI